MCLIKERWIRLRCYKVICEHPIKAMNEGWACTYTKDLSFCLSMCQKLRQPVPLHIRAAQYSLRRVTAGRDWRGWAMHRASSLINNPWPACSPHGMCFI